MTDAPLDLTPRTTTASKDASRWRTAGVAIVVVAAVVALLSQGLLSSLNYFKTVDEVFAQRHAIGTKEIRLEGVVQKGSILRTATGADFVVTGTATHRVTVHALHEPPQLFQANIPVVVVGRFSTPTSFHFVATQIMVKHTASYTAQHPNRVKAPDGTSR